MRRVGLAVFAVFALTLGMVASAGAQDLYDCDDFQFQEDAQAIYDQNTDDPYGLDGPIGPNNDTRGTPGLACEDLPSRGTAGGDTGTDVTSPGTDDGADDDDNDNDNGAGGELPTVGSGPMTGDSTSAASLLGAFSLVAAGAAMVIRRTGIARS